MLREPALASHNFLQTTGPPLKAPCDALPEQIFLDASQVALAMALTTGLIRTS